MRQAPVVVGVLHKTCPPAHLVPPSSRSRWARMRHSAWADAEVAS